MFKNKKLLALAVIVLLAVCGAFAFIRCGHDSFGTERHIKYTLYIGLNDGDSGMQIHGYNEAKGILSGIASKYVDGYTVYEATGFWREDSNTFTEQTLVCVIVDPTEEAVKSIMDETLKALNQHSILLEVNRTRNVFYSGK